MEDLKKDVEIIEMETGFIWYKNGIIFSEIKDHAEVEIEDAKEYTVLIKKVSSDKPSPLLVDFGNIKYQSKEARKYMATDPVHIKTYLAVALVVKNPVAKIIANFYMGLNKPLRPTRLFTDWESAIKWLEKYK